MKLNIYNGNKVIKTYTATTYDLMWGTLEDVAHVVDLENLTAGSNADLVKVVASLALKSMNTVKGLLLDIFDGLTEEEIRNTKIKEIAHVLIDVIKYTLDQMGGDQKN